VTEGRYMQVPPAVVDHLVDPRGSVVVSNRPNG